jgi:phage terminase large subunit-like protein
VECFGAFWDEKHEKDFRWGQEVIQVRGCGGNETIRAASLGGESEGYPFDLIVCDDVQGAKEATTPEQKEKAWRWFTEVVEYRLRADTDDPEDGCIVSIGTRQNPGDIHARLRETDDWKWFCFPAVLKWAVVKDRTLGENGEYELVERDGRIVPVELWENYLEPPVVLVPERRGFTYAELCRERDTKPVQFARKRQNLVRDESAKLFGQAMLSAYCRADGGTDPEGRRKPLLRAWDWHEGKPEEYPVNIHRILIGVDLAATAKTKGRYDPDYTVFAVLGLTDNGVRVLLDVIRFRTGNPKVQRERLLRAVQAYEPSVPPIVEANACQRLWARDAIEQLGIALRMDELKASKLDEIESFADLAYAGKFWYPWDIRDPHTLNIMRAFENELTAYPETRHDDQLMALILAERHVRKGGEVEFSPVVRASAKRLSIVGRDLDDGEKAEMQRAWFEGEEPDGSVGQRIVRRKERRGRRACVPAARWAAA